MSNENITNGQENTLWIQKHIKKSQIITKLVLQEDFIASILNQTFYNNNEYTL